jgi:ParB family chromosome partitioning protein
MKISEGHARALLGLPSAPSQVAALQTILNNDLNVRQTEELVRKLCGEKPVRIPRPAPPPEMVEIEDRLRQKLGTKVSLNRRKQGGTLVIHYYSEEELNALVERILDET